MLGEGVDHDEHGGARGLVKVEHHVAAGAERPLLVEPADLGPRRARHQRLEASHLAVPHRAARQRLEEGGLLANGGFVDTGGAGGDASFLCVFMS